MSGNSRANFVKLYLNQKDEIFIEAKLNQCQIDGLRFLYKQLQKDKPGVILSSPPNCGNIELITQFLGAIYNTYIVVGKPVLIVCDEKRKKEWLQHFRNLSQCLNVILMAPHPFVKKSIFIHTMEDIAAFSTRNWSVLVVDDDALLMDKKSNIFKADYKIWITSLNLKEHLNALEFIYNWLYPKENIKIEDYKPKKGDPKDELEKIILLETFLEDALFQTNTIKSEVKATPLPIYNAESLPKVSKKNKDATGTKIKRSKRLVEEIKLSNRDENNVLQQDVSAIKIAKLSSDTLNNTNNSLGGGEASNEVNHSNMEVDGDMSDVETFIRSKKPIFYDFCDEDFDNIPNFSTEGNSTKNENKIMIENLHNNNNDVEMLTHETLAEVVTRSTDSDENAYDLETQVLIIDNISKETNDGSDHIKGDVRINVETTVDINKDISKELTKESLGKDKRNSDTMRNEEIKENILEANDSTLAIKEQCKNIKNNGKSENTQNTKKEKLDLDSKITEHEDRIFKKFKGTFLDSIF